MPPFEEYRSTIILACVGIYMVCCIAIGIWAMRRTKSTRDFFVAGRDLGVVVSGVAIFSSTLSGFGFVGGPGLVYRMGMSSVWMVVCASMGFCVATYLLAKRIRLFAEVRESVSLPDLVAARYNSELSRFLTALAVLLGVVGYLASQIKAMAMVLQDLLSGNEWLSSLSLEMCVAISVAVLVFYCVTGGIIASVYTDLFQGLVMVVAAVLVFMTARHVVDGGFAGMSTTIHADDPEAIGPWGTLGMFGCLSWYFLFALGGSGQPHVITKWMMNKRIQDAKFILPLSAIGYSLSALLWISIGLAMRSLVLQEQHPELPNADAAAPRFLQVYAHPLLAGVVFAGLFAAIMSTADGFLNIGTAAVVHDIPKSLGFTTSKRELLWARITTVLIAVGAAVFCLKSGIGLIALLGAFGWGIFAAAIAPAVAIGFNWKRATPLAANASIIVSLIVNFTLLTLARRGVSLPYQISPGAAALLVSATVFFAVSHLTNRIPLAKDIETVMDF